MSIFVSFVDVKVFLCFMKKREDKIDIDELYEYFKNLNLSNEVGDSNFEMPDTNDNLASDTIKRQNY
jgi:hypothetical protein